MCVLIAGCIVFLILYHHKFNSATRQGFNLAEMDSALFGGGSDPYVVLSADPREILAGKKLRTPAITHELNPVWTAPIEFRLD